MATRLNVVNPALREARNDLIYPPSADFRWDFTSSIIPQQSMGSIAFTRATTATVTDNDWIIRNCLSGEARFKWARRVQNLFSYSEDASNAYWNKVRALITTNAIAWPSGNLVADLVVGTLAGGSYIYAPMSVIAGNKYRVSVCVKAADVTNFNIKSFTQPGECVFDLALGLPAAPTGIASSPTMTNLWNGWWRCSLLLTASATESNNIGCISQNYVWNICYVCEMQMEDVTGQSDTSFGWYVSTNVLSSPYHGANVDGVKYFDTDVNWVAIPKTTLKWLLAEWARTNLFTDSEDFSLWAKAGTWVITPNATIAPDGRMTADLLTLSTSNEWQSVNKTITTTASIYGYSVYVKPNGHNYVQLLASAGINSWYMNFDLLNGVVGTSSSYTGRIEALPNGWYRLKVTTPTVVATTGAFIIAAVPNASASRWSFVAGTGSSGVYLWWAQLEEWQNVSSYIPTAATTATRNIDSLIMNARNAIDKYWACSFIYTLEDNAEFDRRAFSFTGNTPNRLQFQVKKPWLSGANLFYWDGSGVPSITPGRDVWANNVVIAWTNLSNVSLYMDNTKYNSGVAPNLVFTTVDIGSAGGLSWFWCIKNVRIWKTVPTDAELLALSNSSY